MIGRRRVHTERDTHFRTIDNLAVPESAIVRLHVNSKNKAELQCST